MVMLGSKKFTKRPYLHVGKKGFHKILLPEKGRIVDHINRDTLDNRRCNLRYATCSENAQNRGASKKSKTGIKGISKTQTGWSVRLGRGGIVYKHFNDLREAIDFRDKKVSEIYGVAYFAGDLPETISCP